MIWIVVGDDLDAVVAALCDGVGGRPGVGAGVVDVRLKDVSSWNLGGGGQLGSRVGTGVR